MVIGGLSRAGFDMGSILKRLWHPRKKKREITVYVHKFKGDEGCIFIKDRDVDEYQAIEAMYADLCRRKVII